MPWMRPTIARRNVPFANWDSIQIGFRTAGLVKWTGYFWMRMSFFLQRTDPVRAFCESGD
jgi:hypothetical protein